MSRYLGWLYFINETTKERRVSPAIAVEQARGEAGGRFALHFKSPVSEFVGEWDEQRHHAFTQGHVEEARAWTPISFMLQEDDIRVAIETEIGALLSSNEEQAAKRSTPTTRARRIKFDDWGKGWAQDLVWDPFQTFSDSYAKLKGLEHGEAIIPIGITDDLKNLWLSQEVSDSVQFKEQNNFKHASERVQQHVLESHAQETHSSEAQSQADISKAPLQNHSTEITSAPPEESNATLSSANLGARALSEASASEGVLPVNEVSSELPAFLDIPSSLTDFSDYSQDAPPFEDLFGDASDSGTTLRESSDPTDYAPAPAPAPAIISNRESHDDPLPSLDNSQNMIAAALHVAAEPLDASETHRVPTAKEDEEEDEDSAFVKAIFNSPEITTLDQIRTSKAFIPSRTPSVSSEQSSDPSSGAPASTDSIQVPSTESPQTSSTPSTTLAFRCVRLPAETSPGRYLWDSALFVCDSYVKKEAFDILKPYWKGSIKGGTKKESLYVMEALTALHAKGFTLSLDGLAIQEKHLISTPSATPVSSTASNEEESAKPIKALDTETFVLHAFSQHPSDNAQVIAQRAKRDMVWSRLTSLSNHMNVVHPAQDADVAAMSLSILDRETLDPSLPPTERCFFNVEQGILVLSQPDVASGTTQMVYYQADQDKVKERLAALIKHMQSLQPVDAKAPKQDERFIAPYTKSALELRATTKKTPVSADSSSTAVPSRLKR